MNGTAELVRSYFDLALSTDREAYFAQFADDAVAEDEGHEYQGLAAIRAWRSEVPSVCYESLEIQAEESGWLVRSDISGDFPGSPVTLNFRFTYTDANRISRLAITV